MWKLSNSLAEKVGMEAGDQIIKVNDTIFIDITHKEAVVALKSSKEIIVIRRKHVGIPLIQSGSSAMNRQMTRPPSPPPPPVAEDDSSSLNDRSAVNDRYTDDFAAEFHDIDDENTVIMEMKI